MPVTVVAAAIVAGDPPRLLAAQRAHPPALAGWWELPGGKVGDGEAEDVALARECDEELAVTVAVGGRVGADVVVPGPDGGAVLKVFWCSLVRGQPMAREHAALRWLAPGELGDVAWLPADAPVLAAIRASWPGR